MLRDRCLYLFEQGTKCRGGGFNPQDVRTDADGDGPQGLEILYFVLGESAFRSDKDDCIVFQGGVKGLAKRFCVGASVEKGVFRIAGIEIFDGFGQFGWAGKFRQKQSPGLFGCRDGDF